MNVAGLVPVWPQYTLSTEKRVLMDFGVPLFASFGNQRPGREFKPPLCTIVLMLYHSTIDVQMGKYYNITVLHEHAFIWPRAIFSVLMNLNTARIYLGSVIIHSVAPPEFGWGLKPNRIKSRHRVDHWMKNALNFDRVCCLIKNYTFAWTLSFDHTINILTE